jgi:squalene-hopene/tetraprenyl-beta-curcumene cyclase
MDIRSAGQPVWSPGLGAVGPGVKESEKSSVKEDLLSAQGTPDSGLSQAIARGVSWFLSCQSEGGYWVAPLEADATIPSEYLFLHEILDRPLDPGRRRKIIEAILSLQGKEGGWPLFKNGDPDISATVKAYFALKLSEFDPGDPVLARAREWVLANGGAGRVNVFTRIALALFGQYDWEKIPALPAEMVLLPPWFPISLYSVSYWSRTVIVPLLFIYHHRPLVPISRNRGISELFDSKHADGEIYARSKAFFSVRNFFLLTDRFLKVWNRHPVPFLRKWALRSAMEWMVPRLKGEGGLGAIYPAMANSAVALKLSGYSLDHPLMKRVLSSIDDLVLVQKEGVLVQPCVSPIWDTSLGLGALIEAGLSPDSEVIDRAMEWFRAKEVRLKGDWSVRVPDCEPGGWAFQFENEYYPDVDDTAMVLMGMAKIFPARPDLALRMEGVFRRACRWVVAMQGTDGGLAAFDKDNDMLFLNHIPFADHGALLDPSTADLTGRVLELLGSLGYGPDFPPAERGIRYLRREQEKDGSWFGRWGVNYIYGTWSVIAGLKSIGVDMKSPWVVRAMDYLFSRQNPDGGWWEDCLSYKTLDYSGKGSSTPSQTAWALIALLHGGFADHPVVESGIHFLLSRMNADGTWDEDLFTGTGFPRVFYLRYHMYRHYFPLWALALYRNLKTRGRALGHERVVSWKKSPYPPIRDSV